MTSVSQVGTGNLGESDRSCAYLIAYWCLLCFIFFLPLFEAPKNIFSFLFFVFGFYASVRNGCFISFAKRNYFLALILILIISPFFAGLYSSELEFMIKQRNALNWAILPLLFLVFLLQNYSFNRIYVILFTLCLSSSIGVMESFYNWKGVYPQINSVGHVNQSALYVAFSIVPICILFHHSKMVVARIFCFFAFVCSVSFLLVANSLVANALFIIATSYIIISSIQALKPRFGNRKDFLISIYVALGLLFVGLYALDVFIELELKIISRLDHGSFLSGRDKLFISSFLIAGDSIFGFGVGSFGQVVTVDMLKIAVMERGIGWETIHNQIHTSNHGHNLFATLIVERGWFGVLIFTAFILAMLMKFCKSAAHFYGSMGILTLAMVAVGGIGQTVLHVEHGQLVFILLAICVTPLHRSGWDI